MTDAKVSYENLANVGLKPLDIVEDRDMRKLPVIEMFGPVIQGEGAMIGKVTHFLRLGGCGYRCTWCDSLHAVYPEEVKKNAKRLSVKEICESMQRLGSSESGAKWITISGGDPVMHDLTDLIQELHYHGYKIAIETQGQFFKPWLTSCDSVTVSPKPPSSGMADKIDIPILQAYHSLIRPECLSFKVVVMDPQDLAWAADLHSDFSNVSFFLSVGTTNDGETYSGSVAIKILAQYRWLIEAAQKYGLADVSILPQMHAMLYGHKLGV